MLKPSGETLGPEVPSMMLGPPSPSWTQLGVGSPTGMDKDASSPHSPSEADAPVSLANGAEAQTNAQQRISKRCRPARSHKGAKEGASEPVKRARESAAKPVKRARRSYHWEPEQQPLTALSPSSILIANTEASWEGDLCTVVPACSAQEMAHVDTEEFITEFWGDLLSDFPPMTDDSLIAAAEPAEAAPLSAHLIADADLMGDVTDAQLLELSELLEPAQQETELLAEVTLHPAQEAELLAEITPHPAQQTETELLAEVTPHPAQQTEKELPAQAALQLLQQAEVSESAAVDDPQVQVPAQQISAAQKYRRIRDNNNQASRRSRQQRKQRERDQEEQVEVLSRENARLQARAETLQSLLDKVKALAPLLTARH